MAWYPYRNPLYNERMKENKKCSYYAMFYSLLLCWGHSWKSLKQFQLQYIFFTLHISMIYHNSWAYNIYNDYQLHKIGQYSKSIRPIFFLLVKEDLHIFKFVLGSKYTPSVWQLLSESSSLEYAISRCVDTMFILFVECIPFFTHSEGLFLRKVWSRLSSDTRVKK